MSRILISIVAVTVFFALGLQFSIALARNAEFGVLVAIGDFLSFFTILSNIVVLLVAASTACGWPGFFVRPSVQAAAALYIFVVMLIYHAVLRSQWDPQGWVLIGTALLHYVVPILYLFWWVAFADKSALTADLPLKWLSFPVGFSGISLVRGAVTGWYPYSFLDVTDLGYAIALRNAVMIAMLFLLAGYGLVLLGRRRNQNSRA